MSFIEVSPIYKYAHQALDYRAMRQDLISSNIANIDTPFYKPRDVDFENYLSQEIKQDSGKSNSHQLSLAQTNPNHLDLTSDQSIPSPVLFFRDGHMAKNDGNSVDLDVETSEMGKNSVMYQALVGALKKHKGIFTYALESSKNI